MSKEFIPWPKISRLNREVIVTEKIDGTNACIVIQEDGTVYAQSRKRIITPDDDNFGFASFVKEHEEELRQGLGVGRHYGEWWGHGIQRGYGLSKGVRRFSLFNTGRWTSQYNQQISSHLHTSTLCNECPIIHVVPIIDVIIGFDGVQECIEDLKNFGSWAARGFQNPEGIVAYHKQSNTLFKVTCEKDEASKLEL